MYDVRRSVHHRMLCALSTEIFYNQHEGGAKQFCSQKKMKRKAKNKEQTVERKRKRAEKRGKTGANIMPQIIFISCMRLSAQNCLKMRSWILGSLAPQLRVECSIYALFPANFLGSLWAFLRHGTQSA